MSASTSATGRSCTRRPPVTSSRSPTWRTCPASQRRGAWPDGGCSGRRQAAGAPDQPCGPVASVMPGRLAASPGSVSLSGTWVTSSDIPPCAARGSSAGFAPTRPGSGRSPGRGSSSSGRLFTPPYGRPVSVIAALPRRSHARRPAVYPEEPSRNRSRGQPAFNDGMPVRSREDADRFAREEHGDVLDRLPVEDLVGLLGDVAEVRGEDGAPALPQRMVARQGLVVEDVEAGAGDGSFAQRMDQGVLVDDRP